MIFINAKESGKWNGMEWNGMESGKENFYSCYVERKKSKMESGMEMEWNNMSKCE